ncbi:MAG TPA: hypothetical protein GXZ91_00895 [Christensenellaceae bacterium]|nr:hypothetical protein [Christensenellaceae bacterium]
MSKFRFSVENGCDAFLCAQPTVTLENPGTVYTASADVFFCALGYISKPTQKFALVLRWNRRLEQGVFIGAYRFYSLSIF